MAETSSFSPATRVVLAKAGWTDAYECPKLLAYCEALAQDGYEVSAAARELLRRFGGLQFEIPHPPRPGATDSFHTLADVAVAKTFSDTVERWSEIAGAPLCLVGQVWGGHMGLAMDAQGRVFAGDGELVVYLGASGEQAIEDLCTGAGWPFTNIEKPSDVPG